MGAPDKAATRASVAASVSSPDSTREGAASTLTHVVVGRIHAS